MYNAMCVLAPLLSCTQADLLEAFEVSQQQQLAAAQRQEELLRQLLATASAAPGVPSPGAAIAAAIQVAPWQIVMQAPKLLDYVRLSAPSALDGIVLGTTKGRARVKVRMRAVVGGRVRYGRAEGSPVSVRVRRLLWGCRVGASHGPL